jgi:hypothetical protein
MAMGHSETRGPGFFSSSTSEDVLGRVPVSRDRKTYLTAQDAKQPKD